MSNMIKRLGYFLFSASLLTPTLLWALDVDATLAEIKAYFDEATSASGQAESEFANGDYAAACANFEHAERQFRNASTAAYNAAWKLPGYAGSRDLMDYSEQTKSMANVAGGNAAASCDNAKHSDASSTTEGGQRNAVTESAGAGNQVQAAAAELQATIVAAESAFRLAYDQYNDDQYAEACDNSKRATAAFAKAQSLAHALLARAPDITIDIAQIDENARQSATDEVEVYCAP